MKQKILAVALMAFVLGSFNSFAQCKKDAKKEVCKEASCPDKAKTDCKRACPNPFDGLELTADQQQKVDALRAECRKDENKGVNREEYLAKVKEILTPEQYTQFLEKNFAKSPRTHRPDKAHHRMNGKGNKGKAECASKSECSKKTGCTKE